MNDSILGITLATNNNNKIVEINQILQEYICLQTKSNDKLNPLNIKFDLLRSYTNIEPVEDGNTFEENALIKAEFAYLYGNKPSLSEDSGLCIDALDGAPGVYSKNWNDDGDETYSVAFNKIKKLMKFSSNTTARFVSVFCLYVGKNNYKFFKAELQGNIVFPPIGSNGFAYDRIFIPNGYTTTFAQMTEADKNLISHRRKALDSVIKHLIA